MVEIFKCRIFWKRRIRVGNKVSKKIIVQSTTNEV